MIDELRRAARDLISRRALALAARLKLAVRPLFVERHGAPQLVGSGVLLNLGDATVLLSAAHVLDERREGLFILGKKNLVPLDGEYLFSSAPAEGRDNDKLDVGAVVLSKNASGAAQELVPLKVSELDLDERALGPTTKHYLVLGYPASKAKPRRDLRHVTTEGFVFTSLRASAETYAKLAVHDFSHLVLSFDRRDMTTVEGRVAAPDLYGVSGGGIWDLSATFDVEGTNAKLVAIGVEWHQQDTKAIVGTRVALFTEMIRHHSPSLGARLPSPRGVRVSTAEGAG